MRQILLCVLLALTFDFTTRSDGKPFTDAPFWSSQKDPATYKAIQDARLAKAQQAIDQLIRVKGKRTVDNTLKPYDEAMLQIDAVEAQGELIANVHPNSIWRASAENSRQKSQAFHTALLLDREIYNALAAIDLSKADAETRYYVEKTLLNFRLAGVEKNAEVHQKIKRLRDELVTLGHEFSRNIQSDLRTVVVNNASELEGLPEDYIARHVPDANGKITLTTDNSDATLVLSYAQSDDLRRRMYIEFNSRAYPMNMALLDQMISKRHELASLLGFSSWADYLTADKMVRTAKNASNFLDQLAQASKARADREYQLLLKRKQQEFPGASVVNAWEVRYWSQEVKKSEFDFDKRRVRAYFPYKQVKVGILNLTAKLFGVTFQQIKDVPVWHPSVECWEMLENGKLMGRFYLDMHPRASKEKHAAQFVIRTGLADRQIPEAALVCNFPGNIEGDPGLLEYDDVKDFFHEFGHLIHHFFAGRRQWLGIGGIRTEHDFVEAPSQMLEEWTWDPATLQTVAKHYETGEPIPVELVKQMKRANEFGKGLYVRSQIVFAKMSLLYHHRDPTENLIQPFKSCG